MIERLLTPSKALAYCKAFEGVIFGHVSYAFLGVEVRILVCFVLAFCSSVLLASNSFLLVYARAIRNAMPIQIMTGTKIAISNGTFIATKTSWNIGTRIRRNAAIKVKTRVQCA